MNFSVVILAAGQGKRMCSSLPKVLHQAAGRPLLEHVILAVKPLKPEKIIVVVGHGAKQVCTYLANSGVTFVMQREQLGTGHALMQAKKMLADNKADLMVLNGDAPLLTSNSLKALAQGHRKSQSGMSLLTYEVNDPDGLGRIIRLADGTVERIVEQKDATTEELKINEINPGNYMFNKDVFKMIEKISNQNASSEYYITDLLGIYRQAGHKVKAFIGNDETRLLVGVNNREHLAVADSILRARIRKKWLSAGVTMINPETIYIDDTVTLEPDVTINPNVWLKGNAVLRSGVNVPPNVIIENKEVRPEMVLKPFNTY